MTKYLFFVAGGKNYAISMDQVEAFALSTELSPVPFMPPHFLGLINLRGEILTVYDLRQKLKMDIPSVSMSGDAVENSIFVVNFKGIRKGIQVDEVTQVVAVDQMTELEGRNILDLNEVFNGS